MIPKVMEAKHRGAYRIWLRFADGLEGEIELDGLFRGPVFEPLRDVAEFAKLDVDPDWHTIVWPNGADVAPESLRRRLEAVKSERTAAE